MRSEFETKKARMVQQVLDFLMILWAFGAAYSLRRWADRALEVPLPDYSQSEIYFLALLFVVLTFGAVSWSRRHAQPWRSSPARVARGLFAACYHAMAWLIVITFFVKFLTMSRLLIFGATNLAFLTLLACEWVAHGNVRRSRRQADRRKQMVFVCLGEADRAEVVRVSNSPESHGMELVGWVWVRASSRHEKDASLGSLEDWEKILESHTIDCAVFPERIGTESDAIKGAMLACEERGIEVWLKLPFGETEVRSLGVEHIEKSSYLSFRIGPKDYAALLLKSVIDRTGAAALLVLLSPLLLVVAVMIKATSPGPVIFKQHRAGLYGRRFVFLKFRSMVSNAEQLKASLQERNEMKGPVFKIKDDPRITPLGKFIRKTSIDELPQLINVLRGEMSLIGPRPLPMGEVAKITGWARRRFSLKPGITGLWQVSGRNRIRNFEDWARLDLQYIDRWSLWLDLRILIRTIPAVLKGTGM